MLKNKIEAILFASNKPLRLEELCKLAKEDDAELVKKAIADLKEELKQRESSLVIMETHGYFHVIVHEDYVPYVKKLATKTELSKTVVETLAVVAHKAPVLQSEVIKIRTNKGYDHLAQLEELGYITRERKGRTKLIKLTSHFFEYFSIGPDELQKRFGKATIAPLEPITEQGMEVYERPLSVDELEEAEDETLVSGLATYGHKKGKSSGKPSERTGKPKDEFEKAREQVKQEAKEAAMREANIEQELEVAAKSAKKIKLRGKGISVSENMKERVDDKVNEILGVEKNNDEEPDPEEHSP